MNQRGWSITDQFGFTVVRLSQWNTLEKSGASCTVSLEHHNQPHTWKLCSAVLDNCTVCGPSGAPAPVPRSVCYTDSAPKICKRKGGEGTEGEKKEESVYPQCLPSVDCFHEYVVYWLGKPSTGVTGTRAPGAAPGMTE